MKEILFVLFIIITLIVKFIYNTNNNERISSLFKKLPAKLTKYKYSKELTSSEILALTYMEYASGPEFKKGINNYLIEDVKFIVTGREAKGKEYIIE